MRCIYCGICILWPPIGEVFVVVSSRVLLITNTHCHRGVLQLWHSIFMWVFKFTIIHNWNTNIADPWMSFSCRSSRNLVLDNRRNVTALNYFQYWSPSSPSQTILLLNPETKCCISRGPFFTWSRVFTNDEKTTTKCFKFSLACWGTFIYFEVLQGILRYFGVLQSILGYFWDIQVPLVTFKCFYFPDTFTLQQSLWLIFQLIQISLQYLPSFVSL